MRWVDSGAVITAGGLSSGIAMALHLVDRFAGRDLALRTARQLEYVWDPSRGGRSVERGWSRAGLSGPFGGGRSSSLLQVRARTTSGTRAR